ncbi:unnamed protein product [Owenia fusiformis]|uniref:Uncharacterized protein n=1 Tax=Owenia fusiformis TaxID=6347 RepID=A0A8S4NTB4_OWEFU|nr:unnamed protein product [Owenia fusiformis]
MVKSGFFAWLVLLSLVAISVGSSVFLRRHKRAESGGDVDCGTFQQCGRGFPSCGKGCKCRASSSTGWKYCEPRKANNVAPVKPAPVEPAPVEPAPATGK